MIDWLIEILNTCNQCPAEQEYAAYFRDITFKRTEFEQRVLSEEGLSEKVRHQHE